MAEFTNEEKTYLDGIMIASKKVSQLTTMPSGVAMGDMQIPAQDITTGITHKISADVLKAVNDIISRNSYGIEFYDSGSNYVITRVSDNANLHRANHSEGLPVQKQMKRRLMADDGSINAVLNDLDSRFTDAGIAADLTGEQGQVMTLLPKWWEKCENVGTVNGQPRYAYRMVADGPVQAINGMTASGTMGNDIMAANGYHLSAEMNVASFLMSDKSNSRELGSAAATSVASPRIAFIDADGYIVRETGNTTYPNQSIADGSKRKQCSARGADAAATRRGNDWYGHLYAAQKKIFWLFAVEYATFDSQAAVNYNLTVDGYRQGGLGAGFTNGLDFMNDGSGWSYNNSFSVPNGITVGLGNQSGEVDFYPSKDAQLMRNWRTNRASAFPSLEVVASTNGGTASTTQSCAPGGIVIVRDTITTTSTDYVLQNTSGVAIASGVSVSKTGGTGFTLHAASDTDYVYCMVSYGNMGTTANAVAPSGTVLPEGGNIFLQNANADGTGKMYQFTETITANGSDTIQDYITAGKLQVAVASDHSSVLKGQFVFDFSTPGDSTTARGFWRCDTASSFSAANIANFQYVQDEYHYSHINSFRGVEFPFGYVWQWATDIIFQQKQDQSGAEVWMCVDHSDLKAVIGNNSVLTYSEWSISNMSTSNQAAHLDGMHWKKIAEIPNGSGCIKEMAMGENADIIFKTLYSNSSYSAYLYDYGSGQNTKTNRNMTCLLMGAHAGDGSGAGLAAANASDAVGSSNAHFGSRLCHD